MTPQPAIYSIPNNSNLLYLPFVFFLPEDVMAKCPTLCSLPRCKREIARSEKHIDTIGSDMFLKEIMDFLFRQL